MSRQSSASRRPPALTVARRHRLRLILAAGAAAILVVAASRFVPARYEARHVLDLQLQPTLQQAQTGVTAQLTQELLDILAVNLADPDAAASLNRTLGGDEWPTELTGQVHPAGARQLVIRCVAPTPLAAGRQVEKLGRGYSQLLARASADLLDRHRAAAITLCEQLQLELAQLAQQQRELLAAAPQLTEDNLISARQREQRLAQDHRAAQVRVRELVEQTPPQPQQQRASELQAQVALLQRDLQVHRQQWNRPDDHPLVQQTLARLHETQTALQQAQEEARAAEAPDSPAAVHRRELAAAQQQAQSLGIELAHTRALLEQAGPALALHRAVRESAQRLRNASAGLTQLQELGAQPLVLTHVVTSAATTPQLVAPTPMQVAQVAGVIALLAAAGVLAFLHRTDRTLWSADQAHSELDLPVLGAVDRIAPPRRGLTLAWN